jgi:hypothetical protein
MTGVVGPGAGVYCGAICSEEQIHMRVVRRNGMEYRLASSLNSFQEEMYLHLVDWKRTHITEERGEGRKDLDTFLPEELKRELRMVYPPVVERLRQHERECTFQFHTGVDHVASSQIACVNLLLPVLYSDRSDEVLTTLRPDFEAVARDHLDDGFRFEFWDEPYGSLNDKRETTGTDADVAVAYHDRDGRLCLWLIEHKLTENEFTKCRGRRSSKRLPRHDCSGGFVDILDDKHACYYHDAKDYAYWILTDRFRDFFPGHAEFAGCPFAGGMYQLWRNQLMALSIEYDDRQPFERASFSVMKHPRNSALDGTLDQYRTLVGDTPKFSVLTSEQVVSAAERIGDRVLDEWAAWYRDLYNLQRDAGEV